MTTKAGLTERVAVVLVRARNPQNIGAVARAMHDFGFADLRVVNAFAVPFEAARSAVDASAVLGSARSFGTVAEAVADCTRVLGTTAVGERRLLHPVQTLAEAAVEVRRDLAAAEARVALVFGSEKTGLSNEELSHCHGLVTIPMHVHEELRHPSMNLGQAAAVCLYELVREPGDAAGTQAAAKATAEACERITTLLSEVLERTGYREHHPANSEVEHLRRLVLRMGLSPADAPVWLGMLRQMLWKLRRGAGPEA